MMHEKADEIVSGPWREPAGQAVVAYRYQDRRPPAGELVALLAPTFRGLRYRAEATAPTTQPRPFRVVMARLRPAMWKAPAAELVGKTPAESLAPARWVLEGDGTEEVDDRHVWMLASELAGACR